MFGLSTVRVITKGKFVTGRDSRADVPSVSPSSGRIFCEGLALRVRSGSKDQYSNLSTVANLTLDQHPLAPLPDEAPQTICLILKA